MTHSTLVIWRVRKLTVRMNVARPVLQENLHAYCLHNSLRKRVSYIHNRSVIPNRNKFTPITIIIITVITIKYHHLRRHHHHLELVNPVTCSGSLVSILRFTFSKAWVLFRKSQTRSSLPMTGFCTQFHIVPSHTSVVLNFKSDACNILSLPSLTTTTNKPRGSVLYAQRISKKRMRRRIFVTAA